MKIFCTFFLLVALTCNIISAAPAPFYTVSSPNGKVKAVIRIDKSLTYSLLHEADTLIAPSKIAMYLVGKPAFGINAKVKNVKRTNVDQNIDAPFYKRKIISDRYNELIFSFNGRYKLIFRLYDEGAAYRFVSEVKDELFVSKEIAEFNFKGDFNAYVPYVKQKGANTLEQQLHNSFENIYSYTLLSKIDSNRLAFLPLLVETGADKKVCITEADLENYPGMYLTKTAGLSGLHATFAYYPKTTEQGGYNKLQVIVKEREAYLAKVKGTRNFPWRVIAVSDKDKQLLENDLVYKLAEPSKIVDISWIKPGKVAWDWWNAWNLYGVDFRTGVNNDTYKYYIDFASKYGLEYIILDEGWSVNLKFDLMQVVPAINLKGLVEYARERNVGIILWAGYYAFHKDMDEVCRHYSEMGIKGFKVDFMDRDDQQMVDFYYRAAKTAAKYKLLLDFHGSYKPTGLQRTYPNVLNFEGIYGMEQMKWADNKHDQVTYDVTFPFIRMLAGPVDYTQGAMRNANTVNYRPVSQEAMSQGTRCRQLAEYVLFDSPLSMLCDNPSNYEREPECTEFISSIPTVWDQTIALDSKISKYAVVAKRKGEYWYLGALTNWDKRTLEIDLSFLGEGNFKAEVFRDGINADRIARDYKRETIDIPSNKILKIAMAGGGGLAAKIYRK